MAKKINIESGKQMKVNYKEDLGDLDLKSLPKKAKIILFCLSFCMLSVVALCFYALSEKFSNPLVTIHIDSEHYSYVPFEGDIPDIKLNNFYPSFDCENYSDKLFDSALLELNKGVEIKLTRINQETLKLTLLSKGIAGYLNGDLESSELKNCFSAKIKLESKNPVFSMNMYGNTEFGKQITDASDAYPPLVLNGKITLTDSTIISREQYQLSPIEIRKGDYIATENNANMKGFVRANHTSEAIQGIFTVEDSNIYVQSYRSTPVHIKAGFINRISNDFELAFSLTVLILLIQLFGFTLNLTLRIKFLKGQTELTNEVKKDNQSL